MKRFDHGNWCARVAWDGLRRGVARSGHVIGVALIAALASVGSVEGADGPDFTREVRPILSRYCFKCHGPDDATRKGGLRLDEAESAIKPAKSGKRALTPGNPAASELWARILTTDPDEVMPPPETKTSLTAEQKEVLRRWIESGATYRKHWAFEPVRKPALPAVRNTAWPVNAVDRFVLARLELLGLEPSPPADRATFLRRASLDLLGVPPSPQAIDAFVADAEPHAEERWVDRILASPQYGERWARRWLDLARYADSNGYEKDRPRNMWPWRDWVIRALNRDLPFDQFTLEQLAGDMIPGATLEHRIATGFHRNTMLNEEGGIDPLEFRFHAMTDRVATTGTTWLGLTMQCVQCHTHKYDPIPHREYYQLMALLNNADEPDLDLPDSDIDQRRARREAEAKRLRASLAETFPVGEVDWEIARAKSVRAEKSKEWRLVGDGSVLFTGDPPDRDTYTITFELRPGEFDRIRLETLVDGGLPSKGPGRTKHGNFVLTEATFELKRGEGSAPGEILAVASAKADVVQPGFDVARTFDGKRDGEQNGWAVHADDRTLNQNHELVWVLGQKVALTAPATLTVQLVQNQGGGHLVGRPRISVGRETPDSRPIAVRRAERLERRFQAWLTEENEKRVRWQTLRPRAMRSNLPLLAAQDDGSIWASGDISKSDVYELDFGPSETPVRSLRVEALADPRLPAHGPGMAYYEGPKGDFFLSELHVMKAGETNVLRMTNATHSYAKLWLGGSKGAASAAIDGDFETGWGVYERYGETHEAVFHFVEPIPAGQAFRVKMYFGRHYACSLGRFRISASSEPRLAEATDLPNWAQELLAAPESGWSASDRGRLREEFLLRSPEMHEARLKIEELQRPVAYPTTLVMRERPRGNPRPTHVHKRGEFLQPTDRVEPGFLSALGQAAAAELPRDRVGLARWLTSKDNPLTARVVVNRHWQAFFGRGLVRTTEDFGFQGEAPTHPELLDWLAWEWMDGGWSTKQLHRWIVLSATYRQSSLATEPGRSRDAENKWLSRGPRFRLEAEIIRDAALSAAGLLSRKMGGPSVFPPQPSGVSTEGTYGALSWSASPGEDRYRRGVYTYVKRTAPYAMFGTFDAPSGESCLARREASNTPLQALTLMNDVVFTEAAQELGRRLASAAGTDDQRIAELYRRCLARTPDALERLELLGFLTRQRALFAEKTEQARAVVGKAELTASEVAERAAWVALARVVLNLDETITKN